MAIKKKADVYQMVTDRIVSELEKGRIPWHKPWICPTKTVNGVLVDVDPTRCAYSRSTGKPYSLLNQLLLGKAGEWATFHQIREAGGTVCRGEKSSMVVFWKFIDVNEVNEQGEEEKKQVPMLRYYNVFHVQTQTTGISPKAIPHTTESTETTAAKWNPIEEAEAVASHYLNTQGIQHHAVYGDRAFYAPALDYIQTPTAAQFTEPGEYYSTLYHEMVHSTGHSSRLNRFEDGSDSHAFGSDSYSREELVAEIGAACLLNLLGIETAGTFRNNAAYIQSWIQHLKADNHAIVAASGKAEKAVNLILA